MKRRHKKSVEGARCCWVCGKLGGMGATIALEQAGYEIGTLPNGQREIAYAHGPCLARVRKEASHR